MFYYNESYKLAQDYKFWVDLMDYGKYYNIRKTLLYYRCNENQVTNKHSKEQQNNSKKIRRELIDKYMVIQGINNYTIPNKITISRIKELKSIIRDRDLEFKNILLCYYLSINISFKNILYLFYSFDWMKLPIGYSLRIIRRFLQPNRKSIL